MTSPEQKTISQPEENPTDVGLDIEAAKKYLEEAYGSEKSSVIVDKSIPIENPIEERNKKQIETPRKDDIPKIETKTKVISEELEEKKESEKIPVFPEKTGIKESVEDSPSLNLEEPELKEQEPKVEEKQTETEDLKERIKKEKLEQDARIKSAKNELIDLAKSLKEAREKKEIKEEYFLCDKAKEIFKAVTGENLEKTIREAAKNEAEAEGLKIVLPEEYRRAKIQETQDRIRQKERSAIIRDRWDSLSIKEKEKYFNGAKDKNDTDVLNSAINKFATELKEKIIDKKQEMEKGKGGISISEDTFYELMKKGFKSEEMKKRGFFSRMFSRGEIKIESLDKTDERGALARTKEYFIEMEIKTKKRIEEMAKEEIERKITEGQKRWREKKQRHTREIIQKIATKYEEENKLKIQEETKKPTKEEHQPEVTEKIKSFRTVGEVEKVMKKVETDIKSKQEQKKKIQELKKKMKQGKALTSREKSLLNKIASAYSKSAENR